MQRPYKYKDPRLNRSGKSNKRTKHTTSGNFAGRPTANVTEQESMFMPNPNSSSLTPRSPSIHSDESISSLLIPSKRQRLEIPGPSTSHFQHTIPSVEKGKEAFFKDVTRTVKLVEQVMPHLKNVESVVDVHQKDLAWGFFFDDKARAMLESAEDFRAQVDAFLQYVGPEQLSSIHEQHTSEAGREDLEEERDSEAGDSSVTAGRDTEDDSAET